MADGYLNKCKSCSKKDMYESRHVKHRERVLRYDLERAKRPKRIASAKLIRERWLEKYPERRVAQYMLGNAVRDGRIIPLPCFICGKKAEAHHPDYSQWADVIWLCSTHHKQAHALILEN
jgi:hypothetical protein